MRFKTNRNLVTLFAEGFARDRFDDLKSLTVTFYSKQFDTLGTASKLTDY